MMAGVSCSDMYGGALPDTGFLRMTLQHNDITVNPGFFMRHKVDLESVDFGAT